MREIVLDTETTGLDPFTGDRLVEVGCVELMNSLPTGNTFHKYINPERNMPDEAYRIHGLSEEFLRGKPKFAEIAEEFVEFVEDAKLVIHNAEFDMKFINHELAQIGIAVIPMTQVIDTLALARRKHPGSPNSLDALCSRYRIDNSRRTKHGALLDSEILAEVYLELIGGRQAMLTLPTQAEKPMETSLGTNLLTERILPLGRSLDDAAMTDHEAMLTKIGDRALWRLYK